ncbi:GNAT family N-acetyltransferase [Hahella sp. CCB-MM4]|uniref:GNAT family N-acetyltransferase n=1 Tax=Hahella sp. (strain CCB-MM4) TaxID=1926491 RepID=UPI000B9BA3CA|nr:GNAT family N-acetyltransferase [Hahella sp. CCB-MM4]OZG72948.1 GNAT family N-acetyltransferase [Hahella sp. CCB-MM4]
MYEWKFKAFDELSVEELYEILRVRQQVFIIEQNCIYPDIDKLDKGSWHLFAVKKDEGAGLDISDSPKIHAYLRVVPPGHLYEQPSFGRVLTTEDARGTGAGKMLIKKTVELMGEMYPNQPIKISAQLYLERFYTGFGFNAVSEPYDEDGIPHIDMMTSASN